MVRLKVCLRISRTYQKKRRISLTDGKSRNLCNSRIGGTSFFKMPDYCREIQQQGKRVPYSTIYSKCFSDSVSKKQIEHIPNELISHSG